MLGVAATLLLTWIGNTAPPASAADRAATSLSEAPRAAGDSPAAPRSQHLVPEAFEVPYSGGLVPFGARVVTRVHEAQSAVGQALLISGLGLQALGVLGVAAYGVALIFSGVAWADVSGAYLLCFAIPMSIPFVAPVVGAFFAATGGMPLLALALAVVAGLQLGGVVCAVTARYQVLRFEPLGKPPPRRSPRSHQRRPSMAPG